MQKWIFFLAYFSLIASNLHATHKIKVCKIPMSKIISGLKFLPHISIFHVFVEGISDGEKTTFNFEPQNMRLTTEIMLGTPIPANVSNMDFPGADCKVLLNTPDIAIYKEAFTLIENVYYESAETSSYQLYNVGGYNCGAVAEKAVTAAGFKFPFPDVNAQKHTSQLLFGLGNLRNSKSAQDALKNIGDVSTHAGNVTSGIVTNSQEVGEALRNTGKVIGETAQNISDGARKFFRW